MIFYNYESYFGKRKKQEEEEEGRAMGPDTGVHFDFKKYQWMLMVEKLCERLNMKPDEVYKMNYLDALNWLSMWALKDKWLNEVNKKDIQKIK